MNTRFDTVVVGAGLAGACSARILARDRSVLLVDAGDHDAASPAAVAALANPLMAQKARPGWRVIDALAAFERLVDEIGLPDRPSGLLRPPSTSRQAEEFATVAAGYPEMAAFWSPDEARERTPWIEAPHGLLRITRGGAVSVPGLLQALRDDATQRGAVYREGWRLEHWSSRGDRLELTVRGADGAHPIETASLVLALGPGFGRLEPLRDADLHLVKGQVVRVRPETLPAGMIPVSGRGYAVPSPDGTLVIGSSYEHDFDDSAPTRIQSRRLLARMLTTLPWIRGATILGEHAGLRVTVPGRRTPMVGPLTGHDRVWLFTGLGSKGLLMAPYLAECLPRWMNDPETVPAELSVTGSASRAAN